MTKQEIQKALTENVERLNEIMTALDQLDCQDAKTVRLARNRVVITLFELVDSIGNTEVDIYNYLRSGKKK